MSAHKVNIIITCDVECWPRSGHALPGDLTKEAEYHIYGNTRSGERFGIQWQMDVMTKHGLRGVFFVESLCGTRGFRETLRQVVNSIQSSGHDVELHAHTEWFQFPPNKSVVPHKGAQFLHTYSQEEQTQILTLAKNELEVCGATSLVAFRAGNFGANNDTLAAAHMAGIPFDSSYNPVYLGRACRMDFPQTRTQPFTFGSVWEYPVTCFNDQPMLAPQHLRPLQVTATSSREMASVLLDAYRKRLHTVVILTHSFEMTHFTPGASQPPRKHRLNIHRFLRLCRFIQRNSHLFHVTTFKEIHAKHSLPHPSPPCHSIPQSRTINFFLRGIQNLSCNVLRY